MRRDAPPSIPGLVFVQPLGSGGYADVYLYEQQSPRMPVAVKVLRSEGLTDALRRQFVDEADTMAQLGDHPYIVQVFRAGTSQDGRPYLVMKYYPPPNLATRARSERFSVEDVLRTGIQLASAVETAHRAQITHRDIKPANVLVSAYGAPGLTDFGIAGRGLREGDGAPLDVDGAATTDDVGVSVPWAAPEVLYGQSNGDGRSDVYSLAATLWQLLVGRSPFEVPGGDNSAYALMPRIRSTPPPPTGRPDVPTGLERLLGQALSKDPSRRPATALELARALQSVEQQQRLARTPIVVLDEQGHTTLVSQTQGSPTGAAVGVDDDRTRVKAPQTVLAQPLLPSLTPGPGPGEPAGTRGAGDLDDETRRRGPGVGGRPSPPPSTNAARAHGPAGAVDAPLRPSARTEPTASQTTPWGGTGDEADEATARRPPGAGGPPDAVGVAVPTPDPGGRWPRGPVVLALSGAFVVLVGVVAFLLLRGPGAVEPVAAPRPTVSMPVDDNAAPGAIFDRPVLTAAPATGGVVFSWRYPQRDAKDTFRLFAGPTAAEAGRADPLTVRATPHTVTASRGNQVCAYVVVNRGGQASPSSEPKCETAR